MKKIKALFNDQQGCGIEMPKTKRNWFDTHAYYCQPVVCANNFGWDITTPEDIEYNWDGGNAKDDVVIENGGDFCKSHFGLSTITLTLKYSFKTPENIQLMVIPIPNQENLDFITMSAIVETDWLNYPFFVSLRLLKKGKNTIKKGTPIARIIPINLKEMNNTKIIKSKKNNKEHNEEKEMALERESSNGERIKRYNQKNKFGNMKNKNNIENEDIVIINSFLSNKQCDRIIEKINDKKFVVGGDNSWLDMVKDIGGWDSDILEKFIELEIIGHNEFNERIDIIDTNPNVVIWNEGKSMEPHDDICGDGFPERQYTAIIYLNDDYVGGELVIPANNQKIKPKKGMVVFFEGGRILHGVNEVKKGVRYTIPMWFKRI